MLLKNKNYPLDDVFVKRVSYIAIPMMLQQLITNSVNLVDNIMVGQLGSYAIGGVAAANRFFMLGLAAIMGVSNGAAVYLAQFYGGKQYRRVQESFRLSIVAVMLLILPLVFFSILFPDLIIRFFNKDPGLLAPGREYLPIVGVALIPQCLSFSMQSAMRALGDTRRPLQISIATVLTNVFFNYVLIFGHFGILSF